MRVVLASASPRRHELLTALIEDFELVAADIDEPLGTDAVADATRLAAEKARHAARRRPGAVVVGADTVVFDERRLYGKPMSEAEAVAMLVDLRGRAHTVVTGIAVIAGGVNLSDAAVSTVVMAPLSDVVIARYVASGVPLDKAGAYAIQHEDPPVVDHLDGCYCNVVGLPLWRLKSLLEVAAVPCADPSRSYARCLACPDRPPSG